METTHSKTADGAILDPLQTNETVCDKSPAESSNDAHMYRSKNNECGRGLSQEGSRSQNLEDEGEGIHGQEKSELDKT